MERYIWTAHPYVAYTMVDKIFNPLTLLVGPCLVAYLMYKSSIPVEQGGYHLPWWNILGSYFVWLSATRTLKLLPHLWNNPGHIIYVPAFIVFGYYFAIMKIYALCTLHETGWGTRAGIGDASAATAAMAAQDKLQHNEKSVPNGSHMHHSNNPYRIQLPFSPNTDSASPFRDDPPSPYRDKPSTPISAVPVYATRHTGRKASLSQRRRPVEDEVEMQFGHAS